MQKLYAVEDFIELAKKVQGNIRWNPDWDCSTQQLKGWLKAKLGNGPYTVWAILEGVAAISGRPATYWEIKMANDFWENASATIEKEPKMKIDMNKKYRRVGTHEPVRVICVDRKDPCWPCLGLYVIGSGEGVLYFNHEGYDSGVKVIEEVPAADWYNTPTDTLIWVDGHPRYFADIQGGVPRFFTMGTTSRTYKQMGAEILPVPFDAVISLEEPK